jgi:uncharacterized protein (DUF2267 family)
MSTTGLEVFDKTLQTTHIWLDEITDTVGPDRNVAWHILGAVLRTLRDRLPLGLAAHLGAQLPLMVRGAYYDQFRPGHVPDKFHGFDEFLECVGDELRGVHSVDVREATLCIFAVLDRHVTPEQMDKVKRALPEQIRRHWIEAAVLA